MKQVYISIIIIFFSLELMAQNFTNDAGMRFNRGATLTYRQFFKEEMALEGFIGYYNNGIRLGGLKEFFKPAFANRSDNFMFYFGYGVQGGLTYSNYHRFFNREYRYEWKLSPVFGLNGVIGLEYYLDEVPFLIAIDARPYFEFSLNQIFELNISDITFSIKYRF